MTNALSENNKSYQSVATYTSATNRQPPSDTKRVYLIRHAQAMRHDLITPMDPELTNTGIEQTTALQNYFSSTHLDLIVTSELRRASQTANALHSNCPEVPMIVDAHLNEKHTVGNWRAYNEQDVTRFLHEHAYRPDDRCENGESPRQFHRRIRTVWERLLAYDARSIAVVAHREVLGLIVAFAFGATEDHDTAFVISFPHASTSELWVADNYRDPTFPSRLFVIRSLCYFGYLKPDLVTY